MYYYLVWVRSSRYHSREPLTYSYPAKLPIGSVVSVSMQNTLVPGFVIGTSLKPRFKTKPIDEIYDLPPLNPDLIKLAKWLIEYYPAPVGFITKLFLPRLISSKYLEGFNPINLDKPHLVNLPKLTGEQKEVLSDIRSPNTYLLHGKTGTGKTRVYIELAKEQIDKGRSVIILTPEISLTSQLYENFKSAFGNRVILMHSKQTPKERQLAWLKCLKIKEPLMVLGPRSAIFSPINNIGLIVIDEAHEPAYKQDQLPHYLTGRVASQLAAISRSVLVIGSATPSVSDYFLATTKDKSILNMTTLAVKNSTAKIDIKIVDLKDRDSFSISTSISDQIIESIKLSLERNEQSLLYLNRRGTSRLILCQVCGWQALCPNCNLPLVYHGDKHELRCHSCSFKQDSIPTVCPVCGNDSILFKSVGTKAVYEELKKLFIKARIARFDTDNLKADSIQQNFQALKSGQIDILIGTQQIAKGLDLPKLSTLGVLQADTNLYLPDYSSVERSFQLITQVLGRINRGHIEGRAFVQTYNPDSDLIKSSVNQDYKSFYDNEITQREKYKFPPFYYLLKLSLRRSTASRAESDARKLKKHILDQNFRVLIEGPTPAFHEKFNQKFEWQLVVKSTRRSALISIINLIPASWSYDIDPINLL